MFDYMTCQLEDCSTHQDPQAEETTKQMIHKLEQRIRHLERDMKRLSRKKSLSLSSPAVDLVHVDEQSIPPIPPPPMFGIPPPPPPPPISAPPPPLKFTITKKSQSESAEKKVRELVPYFE